MGEGGFAGARDGKGVDWMLQQDAARTDHCYGVQVFSEERCGCGEWGREVSLSLRDEEKPSMLEIGKRAPGRRNSM